MRLISGGILIALLLCSGCGKEHYNTQRTIAEMHYRAYSSPIAVVKCADGAEMVINRQAIPDYREKSHPVVEGIEKVADIAKSPLGLLVGASMVVDKSGDKTSIDGSAIGNTDSHEVTEIVPEEVVED